MKKLLPLLTGIVLLGLVSCQKDHGRSGNDILVTINTELSTKLQVRGAGDGDATLIDRYTLLVYADGATTPTEAPQVQTKAEGGNFTLSLSRGHDYTFVVWADCDGQYTVGNDGVISLDPAKFAVNDEKLDAFFGSVKIQNVQADVTEQIILKRPFGQLRIEATDRLTSTFAPKNIEVTLSEIYTKFNVLTGEISEPVSDVKCSADVMSGAVLSFNYLLAQITDNEINVGVNITLEGSNPSVINVPDVPMKRNYITSIFGAMLPNKGNFGIDIKSEFEENFKIGIPVRIAGLNETFPTINAALTRLNSYSAGKKIIITNGTYEEDVVLPAGITLQGAGATTVITGHITLGAGSTLKDLSSKFDGTPIAGGGKKRSAVEVTEAGITIENVAFSTDNNATGFANAGKSEAILLYPSATGFVLRGCTLNGYWKGLYLNATENVKITGNTFNRMNPFSTDDLKAGFTVTGNTFNKRDNALDIQMCHITAPEKIVVDNVSEWSDLLKNTIADIKTKNTWTKATFDPPYNVLDYGIRVQTYDPTNAVTQFPYGNGVYVGGETAVPAEWTIIPVQ